MKRTVLLLGAGASIEYGAPGTSELGSQIESEISNNSWIQDQKGDVAHKEITDLLGKYLSSSAQVNFERVYHCVHELQQFFPPSSGAVDEFKFLLHPFFTASHHCTKDSLRALEKGMIESLYRIVSEACLTPKIPVSSFGRFLDYLSNDGVLRIYTTNYDDFPLQAKQGLYTGFPSGNAAHFENQEFWNNEWASDSIFHLHGSVHFGFLHPPNFDIGEIAWFDDKAEALKFSTFTGSRKRQMDGSTVQRSAILTGLDKLSRIQASPLNYYYSALSKDLMDCDRIIVAGSGLGDLHINILLEQARTRKNLPPLMFVDLFPSGFEPMFDNSRKSIEMIHTLLIDAFDSNKIQKVGDHWHVAKNCKAAIWDAGFSAFLDDLSSDFPSVLRQIHT